MKKFKLTLLAACLAMFVGPSSIAAVKAPSIRIIRTGVVGKSADVVGIVQNINTKQQYVLVPVLQISDTTYRVKSAVTIGRGGKFTANITTEPGDACAESICLIVLSNGCTVPAIGDCITSPVVTNVVVSATINRLNVKKSVVMFDSLPLQIKDTEPCPKDPGPNVFSKTQVLRSRSGLKIAISPRSGEEQCAGFTVVEPLGYGNYNLYVTGPLGSLPPNVVLDVYMAAGQQPFGFRFAGPTGAPSNVGSANALFALPSGVSVPYALPTVQTYTFQIIWHPDSVKLSCFSYDYSGTPILVAEQEITDKVPQFTGSEQLNVDFWLADNMPGLKSQILLTQIDFVPQRQ